MEIKISKADVWWGYIAQFFNLSAGILVLPYVLHKLSAEEIGFNYLMLTIAQMAALLDFGFAPQFGRNLSYIFGGAKELRREGVVYSENSTINIDLLATMISVAKRVYMILSVVVLAIMLSAGTLYVYIVTDNFSSIQNVLIVWILFSFSTYFNTYVTCYNSLLLGSGKVKESKYLIIASKLSYIIFGILFVYLGLSLLGLTIACLIGPLVSWALGHYLFYTDELKKELNKAKEVTAQKIKELFDVVWHNAKKLGLNFVAAYGITKMGLFLAGLYLSLDDISSYGLMMQVVNLAATMSLILFTTLQPQFAVYKVKNSIGQLVKSIASSMVVFYILFAIAIAALVLLGPWALALIKSNTELPPTSLIILYSFFVLLESNHSAFATVILISNTVPFVKPAIVSGVFIVLLSFLSLNYTSLGILGLILAQGIVQLAYNNWKWPKYVLNEFNISFLDFLNIGLLNVYGYIKKYSRL